MNNCIMYDFILEKVHLPSTINAYWKKYNLTFNQAVTTSRGSLQHKISYFLILEDKERSLLGIGECSILSGLSIDPLYNFEKKLALVCDKIKHNIPIEHQDLYAYPALQFGLEMAMIDLQSSGNILFRSPFTLEQQPLWINGLIWMAPIATMYQQIEEKLKQGFHCIKIKMGALNFKEELSLLRQLRERYSINDIEIRVDANGAFHPKNALDKLKQLADLDVHSIEQPIATGHYEQMALLVEQSPLAIALDEELIGVPQEKRVALLDIIKPDYLILKPSLLGGFTESQFWIDRAKERDIQWWVTSALESNIGLGAIAQWTATLNNPMPSGLGTGLLYRNNLPSSVYIEGEYLYFRHNKSILTSTISDYFG